MILGSDWVWTPRNAVGEKCCAEKNIEYVLSNSVLSGNHSPVQVPVGTGTEYNYCTVRSTVRRDDGTEDSVVVSQCPVAHTSIDSLVVVISNIFYTEVLDTHSVWHYCNKRKCLAIIYRVYISLHRLTSANALLFRLVFFVLLFIYNKNNNISSTLTCPHYLTAILLLRTMKLLTLYLLVTSLTG